MISKQYRFIQVHIPRTAGSSIQDALWRYRDLNTEGVHPQRHADGRPGFDEGHADRVQKPQEKRVGFIDAKASASGNGEGRRFGA